MLPSFVPEELAQKVRNEKEVVYMRGEKGAHFFARFSSLENLLILFDASVAIVRLLGRRRRGRRRETTPSVRRRRRRRRGFLFLFRGGD